MAYMIDTAASIEELKAVGMNTDQAAAIVRLFSHQSEGLITREYLDSKLDVLRADMDAKFSGVDAKLAGLKTQTMATTLTVGALIIAAMKFL